MYWGSVVGGSVLIWSVGRWSVVSGSVEDRLVVRGSVVGGLVEDLSVGRLSVVGSLSVASGFVIRISKLQTTKRRHDEDEQ